MDATLFKYSLMENFHAFAGFDLQVDWSSKHTSWDVKEGLHKVASGAIPKRLSLRLSVM